MVRALSGVSMTLQEGDRVGLVGHNGSGKSTLLKVLAGIYEPVQGRMLVEGRVTPLFDMMPGLDVEDTGYENLFTAGCSWACRARWSRARSRRSRSSPNWESICRCRCGPIPPA